MANEPIKVGGAYRESKDFVPNPTDMVAQYNTEGVGAHQRIEEVSPIFEVDKVKVSEEIIAALDPKNEAVRSDRVLLPEQVSDNETARKDISDVAKRRVKQGVEVGGPTPAQREAALEGDEGDEAAVEQERSNSAANSTGNRDSGQHGTTASTGTKGDGDDSKSSSSTTAKKDTAKKGTAKKTASSDK